MKTKSLKNKNKQSRTLTTIQKKTKKTKAEIRKKSKKHNSKIKQKLVVNRNKNDNQNNKLMKQPRNPNHTMTANHSC